MKKYILINLMALVTIVIVAAVPVVSNVSTTPSAGRITITYDLTADGACQVSLIVSNDDGSNYSIYPTALTGAIGSSIAPGTGKQINWFPGSDGMLTGSLYKVKVIARDNPVDTTTQFQSFTLVAGGAFDNGTSVVTVSSFYIDKYELTQAEYLAVMGVNPSNFTGDTTKPVEQGPWFTAIEYCNRRSMSEGLTPCYSYSTYGTNPSDWPVDWDSLSGNHVNVACSWTANGYRLPTEAEWQFAARGGNQSHNYTYSGSNTIGGVAWYETNSEDLGSNDPDYGTHPVGTKQANELSIFDMSGNVIEWCWDIYGSYPDGSQINPTGAGSGDRRVMRSGSWAHNATICSVANRYFYTATISSSKIGFRVVRPAE